MDKNARRGASAVRALITAVLMVVVALGLAALITIGVWLWAVGQPAT
ncbi:MAG TPA: hypothetical protein VFY18_13340 [Candidatus Limnocylindrales bacterium]|nr:hypothetical protein [Candidatus Limnocylindrales bacterium]